MFLNRTDKASLNAHKEINRLAGSWVQMKYQWQNLKTKTITSAAALQRQVNAHQIGSRSFHENGTIALSFCWSLVMKSNALLQEKSGHHKFIFLN